MKKVKITKKQHVKILKLINENFTKLNPNNPKIIQQNFNKSFSDKSIKNFIKESDNYDIKAETKKFIEILYGVKKINDDFLNFWAKYGLTYDEICDELKNKNIIIKNGGNYEISKSLGSAEEAKEKLEKALNDIINKNKTNFELLHKNVDFAILKNEKGDLYLLNYGDIEDNINNNYEDTLLKEEGENESSNEFIGIRALDVYPFNQLPNTRQEVNWDKRGVEGWGNINVPSIDGYSTLQILSKDDLVYYINEFKNKFKQEPIFLINKDSNLINIKGFDEYEKKQTDLFYGAAKQTMANKNESEIKNINLKKDDSESDILLYANKIADKAGEGLKDLKNGVELVKIDKELKDELLNLYDKNHELTSILSDINEMEIVDIKPRLAEPWKQQPSGYEEKSPEEKEMIRQRLAAIKAKSDAQDVERFRQRDLQNAMDSARGEKELTTRTIPVEPKKPIGQYNMFGGIDEMGTAGVTGGPMGGTNTQTAGNYQYVAPLGHTKRKLEETTQGESSIGQYDVNALPIGRNGEFKKVGKTKAETTPQWAGGAFVEFDDCTKLNNKPAGSGCSAGAVDGVVKLKKAKGSVNAPSLAENKIYETIAKQTGKTIDEVKRIIESNKNKS